jgi:hypothetical protein
LSSTEEDERKEYVRSAPNVGAGGAASEVTIRQSSDGTVQQVIAEPSPSVERETVAKHTSTNMTTLVGLAVGIVVLATGLFLVIRETPFLPYPWSILAVLVVGVALIGVGASLVSNRTTER